ncbi:MAG: RNA-binding protein [Candidatus Heimdallarchaeota archaeon]|nr:MAG: RNA-binding protein [Candidatus Heimdallarchaeota archaeon]
MTLLVTRNQIVVPGEVLARGSGLKAGGGVYRKTINHEVEICASMIGLAQVRKNRIGVVPLEGCYIPLEGDIIIGLITRVGVTSWNVDIRGPYVGTLKVGNVIDRDFDSLRESLDRILQVGDIIKAQITYFDRTRDPVLTLQGRGLRKINIGRLIEVDPVKIPRIIGKKGSMIQLLKNMTNTQIIVGQNGRIVIIATDIRIENLVERSIRKIEAEAHTSGLTDRIREFLEKEKKQLFKRSEEDE